MKKAKSTASPEVKKAKKTGAKNKQSKATSDADIAQPQDEQKLPETIALGLNKQKKVSKQTVSIKKQLKAGAITIKESRKLLKFNMKKAKSTASPEVKKAKKTGAKNEQSKATSDADIAQPQDEQKLPETIALDLNEQKKVSKQTVSIKKQLKAGTITIKESRKILQQKAEEQRGLVYIGHIPHGFYEEEMKKYFKQFGKVTNVKVCRSRITGNSKGFGYIEFKDAEVAQIAADTMNNYIMFKKRIVTEYVPYEKRPRGLFHGKSSNQEHTSVQTRRGKQKFSRNKQLDEETVLKKMKTSLKKFDAKVKRLASLGIECNVVPVMSS